MSETTVLLNYLWAFFLFFLQLAVLLPLPTPNLFFLSIFLPFVFPVHLYACMGMGSWELADRQPGLVMGRGGGGEVDGGGQSPSRLASLYFAAPLPGDGAIQYNSFSPFTHLSNAFTEWTVAAAILLDY